jgi:WhiB family redox-sensing transcriptional regulator
MTRFDPDAARAAAADSAYPDNVPVHRSRGKQWPNVSTQVFKGSDPPPPTGPWAEHAACKGRGNLMFPEPGNNAAHAIAICGLCPVRNPCREYALEHLPHDAPGVWGAMTVKQRREIRRRTA